MIHMPPQTHNILDVINREKLFSQLSKFYLDDTFGKKYYNSALCPEMHSLRVTDENWKTQFNIN